MAKVNQLILALEDYENEEKFENEIKNAIMLLLNAGYIATVRYDDKGLGIVVIEYNYVDLSYGERYPYWLYPEEEESIIYKEE